MALLEVTVKVRLLPDVQDVGGHGEAHRMYSKR